jgi:hypothetical protein
MISTIARTLALGAGAIVIAACGGSSPASPPAGPVATVAQPPTVAQVAASVHATAVTDCGPAPAGGVTGSGTAMLGAERITIDIFPGPGARDSWKKIGAQLGIAPFAQGPDWVAYKSVSQTGRGCG